MLIDERLFGNAELVVNGLHGTFEKWDGELLVRRNTLGCHLWHQDLEADANIVNTSVSSNLNIKFEFENYSDVRVWDIVVNSHG